MSADILDILARMTLAASAAIVVILLLRRPLRAAFGAQIAYASWLMAPLATLAVLIPARQIVAQTPIATPATQDVSLRVPTDAASAAQPASESAVAWPMEVDVAPLLLFVWLVGVFFSMLLLLRGHQRFLRNADSAGPAVIGFLRPRIVLPRDFEQRYTPAERDLVVAHERAHLAAFDAQINALAAFAQCLNWFNPLFHIARKALRVDQELACDARVMARRGDARRVYAEAMLKAQMSAEPVLLGCQWPPIGAGPLKQRIAMLARPHPTPLRTGLGALCCAITVFTVAGAAWIAQPPRVAYAAEQNASPGDRALGRQLVAAMQEGQMDEARELIAAGADVNTFVRGDGTPLVIAARFGARDMVDLLIERGADVNQPAPGDGNPLIMAAAYGRMEIVTSLVERGADVNGVVHGDETPLINAARENRLDVARYLIARGADVNLAVIAPTVDGSERRSPLSMARRGGHEDMVRLLREHGATS
jgi:beta-lactamase regulating signal transducer with metallopeptidase domain/ankyrin repeat protein